ncbi:MAG TPA: hypothetical protein VHP38_16165, partial [Ruminiclostridium sp.]|nr:hypothetical protein [Ruminiclostridium sp.]
QVVLGVFTDLLQKYPIIRIVQAANHEGWSYVWQEFDTILKGKTSFSNTEEKNVFIDLFFSQCLKLIFPGNYCPLFTIIEKWLANRSLQIRCGDMKDDEKIGLIHFCVNLREKLKDFFLYASQKEISSLTEEQEHSVVALWRQVFFEPFSAISLYWDSSRQEKENFIRQCKESSFNGLMVASMYQPFAADEYDISAEGLYASKLPFWYKVIIGFWMVNTPYFHGEEKHRQKLVRYVPELCAAAMRHPEVISTPFFFTFVQEVMTGLWRASYFGGNNRVPLSAFGDFITFVMTRSFPYMQPKPQKLEAGKRLRIGYISRNFYTQAVSCYMVNRVIHHDKIKFEVYVYALGEYHDEISELFKQHSDHFQRFTNMADLRGIVETILAHKLDMLLYTDIGMDPATYMLSGLQLAPVQCAMVGHGTTTGMPNIQYYISGDFEGPKAQDHYRERLIRLPQLGAAQYMPMVPEKPISRKELGVPDNAVVFISCANGLKHGGARDQLLVEILKKAPNAWILLKPYAHQSSMDLTLAGRIRSAAKKAGVGERLIILPPIGQARHVMGLLSIADVQLDTFPYGGWTTNLEALYMGLPIVTQQGELARSRWGSGMLKALDIKEGIAQNEKEYVDWAVRFAKDPNLLKRLKARIKKKAKDILFNGSEAQPVYEENLLAIYQESCSEAALAPVIEVQDKIPIVTSLTPDHLEIQKKAMQSWQRDGFKVISVNSLEQIPLLQPYFEGIEFAATIGDTRKQYKPYTYFDDILTYFRQREFPLCGIISPDIYLNQEGLSAFVLKEAKDSFVYGSVIEVDGLNDTSGTSYDKGFDYFFFDRKVLAYYPRQEFCMGMPWWDYWAVLVPLMRKFPVKKILSPIALHRKHANTWDQETWLSLGTVLSSHFHPPFTLSRETMTRFASETLTIINTLSETIAYSIEEPKR